MSSTIKDYAVQVYWDGRAGYFVAEIPEIPTCAADGSTQGEALANLEATFAVMKEAYQEEGLEMPGSSPQLPISVAALSAISPLVKIAKVAQLSGIPVQTLATKVKRGTEFSVGESRRIARTLSEHGVTINATADVMIFPQHGGKGLPVAEAKQLARNKPSRGIERKIAPTKTFDRFRGGKKHAAKRDSGQRTANAKA
jgi:predicted RNase H-like HicB family nuclease